MTKYFVSRLTNHNKLLQSHPNQFRECPVKKVRNKCICPIYVTPAINTGLQYDIMCYHPLYLSAIAKV